MARDRVMLVDRHYLVRVGLANVLGFEAEVVPGRGPAVTVEVRGAPRRLSVAAEHHLFRQRGEKPERGFHFGLSGMRERARALGTRLEVESAPGRGTTVRVRWSGNADPPAGAPEA